MRQSIHRRLFRFYPPVLAKRMRASPQGRQSASTGNRRNTGTTLALNRHEHLRYAADRQHSRRRCSDGRYWSPSDDNSLSLWNIGWEMGAATTRRAAGVYDSRHIRQPRRLYHLGDGIRRRGPRLSCDAVTDSQPADIHITWLPSRCRPGNHLSPMSALSMASLEVRAITPGRFRSTRAFLSHHGYLAGRFGQSHTSGKSHRAIFHGTFSPSMSVNDTVVGLTTTSTNNFQLNVSPPPFSITPQYGMSIMAGQSFTATVGVINGFFGNASDFTGTASLSGASCSLRSTSDGSGNLLLQATGPRQLPSRDVHWIGHRDRQLWRIQRFIVKQFSGIRFSAPIHYHGDIRTFGSSKQSIYRDDWRHQQLLWRQNDYWETLRSTAIRTL